MSRWKITAIACATAAFGFTGVAQAAQPAQGTQAAPAAQSAPATQAAPAESGLSRSDTRFLQRAAQSGKLEIDASQLALQRAQSQEVKDFAQKMITDHQAVDKELRTLAQSKNVELPADLRWGQGRTIKGLEDREGADFDERYVDKVAVDAHEDAVSLFEEAAEDADDADVKAFAAKVLPDLKHHLSMGEALKKSVEDRGDNTPAVAPATNPGTMGTAPAAPAAGAAGTNR